MLPLMVASPSTNINIPLHLLGGLITTLLEIKRLLKFLMTGGPSNELENEADIRVLRVVIEPLKLPDPSLLSPK
jgi:hypothetical protein